MYKFLFAGTLAAFCHVSLAQTPLNLITSVAPDPKPPHPERQLESWIADFNVTALRSGLPSIWLNLPDGTTENINLVHFEAREGYVEVDTDNDGVPEPVPMPDAADSDFSWRWYGRSEKWTVAITLEAGEIAGRITSAGQRYGITPLNNGRARLGLVNSAYWRTHPEDSRQHERQETINSMHAGSISPTQKESLLHQMGDTDSTRDHSTWDHRCTAPLSEDIRNIDVLVFYTPGVLTENQLSVPGAKAAIRSALDDANQSLSNSEIGRVRFWLRGIEPADTVNDYDGQDIVEALELLGGWKTTTIPPHVIYPGNSYITARRNAYGADVVALARDPGDDASCGKAIIQNAREEFSAPSDNIYEFKYAPGPDFKKFSYIVFNPACGVDRLNLAHELGHTLGMEHDPNNSSPLRYARSCPWSYGHRRPGPLTDPQRFRTVMSYYEGGPLAFTNPPSPSGCIAAGDGCPLIDAYSTPDKEWTGFSISPPGTAPGASRIGVNYNPSSASRYNGARASDTLVRMAAIVENFGSRSTADIIFVGTFE